MKRGYAGIAASLVVAMLLLGCTDRDVRPTATSVVPTASTTAAATATREIAVPTSTDTPMPTVTSTSPAPTSTFTPVPAPTSTPTRTATPPPLPTATELPATPTATQTPPASTSDVLFQDGFEGGQAGGSLANWTSTELENGSGLATAEDDTSVSYEGSHSARFQVTDGTQGGVAYVSQTIAWPSGNRLWYSCYFRVDDYTNAAVGGIYILEAFVKSGAWRDRADIEIVDPGKIVGLEPGQALDSSTFLLRMAYRGRDGGRDGHRQSVMIQAPARHAWHHVQMLVDRRQAALHYAWWLDDRFIWQGTDTSAGPDTDAPTDFHAGVANVDWAAGNRARVWVDNCTVAEHGPEPPG